MIRINTTIDPGQKSVSFHLGSMFTKEGHDLHF